MAKLSKVSALLHRWGYDTRGYKRYSKEMQMALDYDHLNPREFIIAYQIDIVKAIGADEYDYLYRRPTAWIDFFRFCARTKGWNFIDAYQRMYERTYYMFPYIIRKNGMEKVIYFDDIPDYEAKGYTVYLKNL